MTPVVVLLLLTMAPAGARVEAVPSGSRVPCGQPAARGETDGEHKPMLKGRVRASDGTELPGVAIELKLTDCDCAACKVPCEKCCPAILSVTTDSKGEFSAAVGPGTYSYRAELAGFMTYRGTVTVSASNPKKLEITFPTGSKEE